MIMNKFLLMVILILNCVLLIGCSSSSIDEIKESIEVSNYIVDIKYNAIYGSQNNKVKTNTITFEKVDNECSIIEDNNKSLTSFEQYFFWLELLTNDNFDKKLFKYNGNL